MALSQCFMSIHTESVTVVYDESIALGLESKQMIIPENFEKITARARDINT